MTQLTFSAIEDANRLIHDYNVVSEAIAYLQKISEQADSSTIGFTVVAQIDPVVKKTLESSQKDKISSDLKVHAFLKTGGTTLLNQFSASLETERLRIIFDLAQLNITVD